MLLFVHISRNSTPVIQNGDGIVLVHRHLDTVAETSQGLIDGVVDHLIYQVVQAPLADVTNIHGRTLSDCLQALQHLYIVSRIVGITTFYIL